MNRPFKGPVDVKQDSCHQQANFRCVLPQISLKNFRRAAHCFRWQDRQLYILTENVQYLVSMRIFYIEAWFKILLIGWPKLKIVVTLMVEKKQNMINFQWNIMLKGILISTIQIFKSLKYRQLSDVVAVCNGTNNKYR